jgi:hypothetical protein
MTEDLRADLDNRQVDVGEEIYVEVIQVNEDKDRVLLRELPEPEDAPGSDVPEQQLAA